MNQVTLNVQGMTCGHCVKSVEGAVHKLGGTAKVDLTQKSVEIEYDETQVTIAAIKEAIEDQGYDVI